MVVDKGFRSDELMLQQVHSVSGLLLSITSEGPQHSQPTGRPRSLSPCPGQFPPARDWCSADLNPSSFTGVV